MAPEGPPHAARQLQTSPAPPCQSAPGAGRAACSHIGAEPWAGDPSGNSSVDRPSGSSKIKKESKNSNLDLGMVAT